MSQGLRELANENGSGHISQIFQTELNAKEGTCKCGGLIIPTTHKNAFEDSLHEIDAELVALPSTININTY